MFIKNTTMALEPNGAPEHFISDINETELIESENYALHDIIKEEIVEEEPTETKFFSSYAGYNESHLEQGEEKKFPKPDLIDLNQLEDILEENEVPKESKLFSTCEFPSTDACEYMNFKVEGEQENPKDNFFDKIKIKHENQDYSKLSGYLLTNYHEMETEILKTEDNIDIEYVKPEICGNKDGGKSENKPYSNSTDILMGTKIGSSFPQELPTDSGTGPQQSATIGEDETGAKWDNGTRKEPTITNNSKNGLIIHTGGILFQCKVCSKLFSEKRILVEHKKSHR